MVARFRAAIAGAGAAEGHHQAHEVGPKIRGEVQESLAWLTDVLERMVSGRTKAHELERLLPWTWQAERLAAAVEA